jgi:hypothetical protein
MGLTKRVPIGRPSRRSITPEALDLFAEIQTLECTRPPARYDCPCADCLKWEKLYNELWSALGGRRKPWQRSCVVRPDGVCDEDSRRTTAELEAALAKRHG